MKNALIAAASLAAIAAVIPAAAQAQDAAAASNVGAYVNLGGSLVDAGQADVGALGARLGYRFNNWIGVEGELAAGVKSDTDTIGGVDVNTKLRHAEAAYVVGFAPINPSTDLLARVGYGSTSTRTRIAGISDRDTNESWNFGVGAQHRFDGVNGVRVDYTRQEFNHDAGHANVWAVAYTRKF